MIESIRNKLMYFLGVVIGFVLYPSVKLAAIVDTPVARRHNRPEIPKPFVDPRILIAKDIYGHCHHRNLRPDTPAKKPDDLILGMAANVAHFAKAHADETGELLRTVAAYSTLWTGNRATLVRLAFDITPGDEPGLLKIELTEKERQRLDHLGRYMNRFRN